MAKKVVCDCGAKLDSSKFVKKESKIAVFYIKDGTYRNVSDIIKYHPFKGTYIICNKCETLITC